MKKKKNPLIESLAEIKRLEMNSDIKMAYKVAKRDLGDNFDAHMISLSEEIIGLQKSCKPEISYYIAGLILAMPPDKDVTDIEMDKDDVTFYSMMIKAAIGWGLLNGHGSPDNPFLDELREL